MSIIEIEQKLKSLNQQLADLESQISDPIERNESKQQLNRQIKKLERNLRNLEQLQLQQQELESLQSELNSNHPSSTFESVISESQPTKNISLPTSVAIDLEKSTPIKQTENQNLQPIEKAVTYSVPTPKPTSANGLKDWQKSVLTGAVMGLFVLLGLAIIQPNKFSQQKSFESVNTTQSAIAINEKETEQNIEVSEQVEESSVSSPSFTQEQAVNLIEKWLNAKREIFASPFNRELGAELLTGKAYYDKLGNPEGSVGWLQNNSSYYTYGVQSVDSVENFVTNENYATIDVVVTEQRTLYNKYGGIDRNASGFDTRVVRYNLESEDGQWKIAEYNTIKKIK